MLNKTQRSWMRRGLSRMWAMTWDPVNLVFRPLSSYLARQAINVAKLVASGIVFLVCLTILAYFTALFYWFLYWLIMPKVSFESTLYFDFDPESTGQFPMELVSRFVATGSSIHDALLPKHPTATLRLDQSERQWTNFQLGEVIKPGPVLTSNQEYDIWIDLVVPDNLANKGIGVFMINTTLTTSDNTVIAMSKRPAIMRPSYSVSSFVYAVGFQWLTLLGYSSGEQLLQIRCFERYMEQEAPRSTTGLHVTLSNPYLQIHSAQIYFMCQLHGLRYLMYYWQWTTFAVYMLTCTCFQACALAFLFCFLLLTFLESQTLVHDGNRQDGLDSSNSGPEHQSWTMADSNQSDQATRFSDVTSNSDNEWTSSPGSSRTDTRRGDRSGSNGTDGGSSSSRYESGDESSNRRQSCSLNDSNSEVDDGEDEPSGEAVSPLTGNVLRRRRSSHS